MHDHDTTSESPTSDVEWSEELHDTLIKVCEGLPEIPLPGGLTVAFTALSPNLQPLKPACEYETQWGMHTIRNRVVLKNLENNHTYCSLVCATMDGLERERLSQADREVMSELSRG